MRLDFTLENKLCELQKLHAYVETLHTEWQICNKTTHQINLILEELFSNIVLHGNQAASNRVEFSIERLMSELRITVSDNGPAFDMTCSAQPDISLPLEKRKCGGLGILLVQKICDSCHYTRKDGKNTITLSKTLPKECS